MCTQAQLPSIVREMTDIYDAVYGDTIRAIYLYGSYARGDASDQSDIDLAAVVVGDRKDLQERLKVVWDRAAELGLDYDVVVSPTVIPYDEFESYRSTLPYYRNIVTEGKLVG